MAQEEGVYFHTLWHSGLSAMHTLDDLGCRLIVAEALPDAPGWMALQDRLMRAAHGDAGGEAD